MRPPLRVITIIMLFLGTVIARAQDGVTPPIAEPDADSITCKHINVKVNAVALGLLITNATFEIDLKPHWSFNFPIYYSAWNYFTYKVKFRTLSFFPELRYWPSAANDGWFVGAHLGLVWWNLATGGDYRRQDHRGRSPARGGGIGGGWRTSISRNGKWYLELAASVGGYGTNYDRFHNVPNGRRTEVSHHGSYFGPDMVSVSFAYRFNVRRR